MMDTICLSNSCLNDGSNQDRLCESSIKFMFFSQRLLAFDQGERRKREIHKRLEVTKPPFNAFKDHKRLFAVSKERRRRKENDLHMGNDIHTLTRLECWAQRDRVITT